jgi:GntR family transcriptional regulator
MLPFAITLQTGQPVSEQVVYGVKRAIVAGQLRPGAGFPSVRALSQELSITPNTAHKIVAALTAEGLLEVRPGIGTLAAEAPVATREQLRQLLQDEVEALVVEARKYGLGLADVQDALTKQWEKLS